MSALAADLRTEKSAGQCSLEAVVVNSIIYSKPSFCTLAVDLGNVSISSDNKPASSPKLKSGNFPNNSIFQNEMDLKNSCTNFLLPRPPADAKVYRICTTINGSIQHKISDLCDNILTMAGIFDVAKDDDDEDSLVDFGYRDDDNLCLGVDLDDDSEEDEDDEDEDDYEYEYENLDDDDDNDVVDFSYDCPIEPAPKLHCDKKKKVRFNTKPTVHYMHTWTYARRAARKGEWEMYARDRDRFKLRIQRAALILNPILEKEHRQKIYEKRFFNFYDNKEYVFEPQAKASEIEQNKATTNKEDPAEKTMENKEASINEPKKTHQKKRNAERKDFAKWEISTIFSSKFSF